VSTDRSPGRYAAHVAGLQRSYEKALAAHGFDAVVVHGGAASKRSDFDDQWWPLRATPHFQHWVALSEPDAALVVRAGRRPTLLRVTTVDFWEHALAPESEHFVEHFEQVALAAADDAKATSRAAAWPSSATRLAHRGALGHRGGQPPGAGGGPRRAAQFTRRRTSGRASRRPTGARRRATRRCGWAFFEGASSELELHLAYLAVTQQDDPETPYKNIVAYDGNAATLHHVAYARRRPGEAGPTDAAARRGGDLPGVLLGHHPHVGARRGRRDVGGVPGAGGGRRGAAAAALRRGGGGDALRGPARPARTTRWARCSRRRGW
jgi:Xaa-Pro dipeptidase